MRRTVTFTMLALGLAVCPPLGPSLGLNVAAQAQDGGSGGAATGGAGGAAGATGTLGATTNLPGVDTQTSTGTDGSATATGRVDNCGADTSMQGTGTAGSSGVADIGAGATAGASSPSQGC